MPARSSLKNSSTKSSISRRSSGAPASTESMSTHLPPIEMLWNNLSTISSPSLLFLAYLDSVTLQRKLAFYAQRLMETEGCVPATTSVALQQDASLLSDFGTGTNLQNIEDRLRSVFVADKGMKFAYVDLEQAESRLVGAIEWNLFRDGTYLDACESGDLHTSVCRLAWGSAVNWTGD